MYRGPYQVVTIEKPPFVMYDPKTRIYSGLLIDLFQEIAERLNITYTISLEKSGLYGYQDEYGNWDGIMRQLTVGRADIGLAALSLMSERLRAVDFTDPIYPSNGVSIIMQKPIPNTVLFRFFTVLDVNVWLCVVASYLFTSGLMWSFHRFSPYSFRNFKKRKPEEAARSEEQRNFDIKESLWFCLTSLTPQGGGEAPRNYSGRLIATTWWLFGFIIVASYTANLAAFLTLSRFDRAIESFEDLIGQYKYSYTAVGNSEASRYFERRKDIEFKFYDAWKALVLNDSLSDYERSMLSVWEYPMGDRYNKINSAITFHTLAKSFPDAIGKFTSTRSTITVLAEATDVQYQVLTNCTFQEIGPEFSKKPYAIALRKNSPLTDKFNDVIRELYAKKWIQTNRAKWWENNPKRVWCYNMDEKSVGILIENIGGLFLTILFGIGISLTVMAGEYIYLKYYRERVEKYLEKRREKRLKKKNDKKENITHIEVKE